MSHEIFNFIGKPKECWVCHRQAGEDVLITEKREETILSETTKKIEITRIAEEIADEVYYVCQCCRTLLRGFHILTHATTPFE